MLLRAIIHVTVVRRKVRRVGKLIRKTVTVLIGNCGKLRLLIDRRPVRPVIPGHVTVLLLVLGGHDRVVVRVSVGVGQWELFGHELDWSVRIWGKLLDQAGVLSAGAGLEVLVLRGSVEPGKIMGMPNNFFCMNAYLANGKVRATTHIWQEWTSLFTE